MSKAVFTIGYESRTLEELLDLLESAGIKTLLDCRIRAASRKPGFSKSRLADACKQSGFNYVHDRNLGTPPAMMDHVRSGSGYDAETTDAYREYLVTVQHEALANALEIAAAQPTCLLCFELEASNCHRRVVAEEIASRSKMIVKHL